jgi:hypothetical protein
LEKSLCRFLNRIVEGLSDDLSCRSIAVFNAMADMIVPLQGVLIVAAHLDDIDRSGSNHFNNHIHAVIGQATSVSDLGKKEEPERR